MNHHSFELWTIIVSSHIYSLPTINYDFERGFCHTFFFRLPLGDLYTIHYILHNRLKIKGQRKGGFSGS